MCLGVLCEVVAVGDVAGVPIADLRTETGPRRVSLLCLPDPVAPGDVVLVQFGHAVAVLDPEAAAAATAEAP